MRDSFNGIRAHRAPLALAAEFPQIQLLYLLHEFADMGGICVQHTGREVALVPALSPSPPFRIRRLVGLESQSVKICLGFVDGERNTNHCFMVFEVL